MDKAGTVTVLHTFTGPDGSKPLAALVQGADGGLYGSTVVGGAFGLGVLFRIEPVVSSPVQKVQRTMSKKLTRERQSKNTFGAGEPSGAHENTVNSTSAALSTSTCCAVR
jgi:uncharacterized repeat protein (TIGR03803 family)